MDQMARPASAGTAEPCQFADDLLEGAEAISLFLYGDATKRRKVYHLADKSRLPVFRLGAVLCARKSKIIAYVEGQEQRSIEEDGE